MRCCWPSSEKGDRSLPYQLIRPGCVAAVTVVDERELMELLAGGSGIVPSEAGAAQAFFRQADAASDGLQREIEEAVGAQLGGHAVLLGLGEPAAFHESWREQLL